MFGRAKFPEEVHMKLLLSMIHVISIFIFSSAMADEIIVSEMFVQAQAAFHDQCGEFQPLAASSCAFMASFNDQKDLTLVLKTPNHLDRGGQFQTDFPNVFSVTIPSASLSFWEGSLF